MKKNSTLVRASDRIGGVEIASRIDESRVEGRHGRCVGQNLNLRETHKGRVGGVLR